MKYTSKKGTVINIPNGASKKQIKQIKADADAGYGTRAQQTADKIRKQLGKDKQKDTPSNGGGGGKTPSEPLTTIGDAVNNKGTVNPDKASDAIGNQIEEDVTNQFKLDHPMRMVDQYGNVRIVSRDPVTGEVTVTDEVGGTAQTFKDLATAAAQTFNGDVSRQRAEEATYNTLTRYMDRDKAREVEAAQQEMADRGIPYNPAAAYDPNTDDLYGKTLGTINQRYDALRSDASQQAILSGNQAYQTDASARDSFINAALAGANQFQGSWTPYQNQIDATQADTQMDILKLSADQYMTKYGIDQDTYIKKKALAQQNQKAPSGGGGGGGGSPAGFEIVG